MADKKISQLSSATAPLAGTEVIPIVQASETKKVTVSGLFTAYTFTTSATGPLVIGGTGTTSTLTLRSTSGVGTTGADIIFQTGNNGATEVMRMLNSGNVGIGTASPARKLTISGAGAFGDAAAPAIRFDNTSTSRLAIIDYDNSQNLNIWNSQNSGTGAINFYSSTGSGTLHMTISGAGNVGIGAASPAGKLDVVGASYIGADSNNSCYVTSTSSLVTIAAAGRTSFSTSALRLSTSDGSAVLERMRIDSAGNVGIGTASPSNKLTVAGTINTSGTGSIVVAGSGGLGYTTGSGGAVTQATSRTTGVTLDKTNGAITLVSAAGTATWQTFTVTNNTVAATDTIIVNQKSGTDLYQIFVTNVAAGSFKITFATTGGTTTEQPVFNFSVIKAATS